MANGSWARTLIIATISNWAIQEPRLFASPTAGLSLSLLSEIQHPVMDWFR